MPTVRTCINRCLRFCGVLALFGLGVQASFWVSPAHAQELEQPSEENMYEAQDGSAETSTSESAQSPYVLGEVVAITEEGIEGIAGFEDAYQIVLIEIANGVDANDVVTLEYRSSAVGFDKVRLHKGDPVILVRTTDANGVASYGILERFRLPVVFMLGIVFAILAIIFGRWKGLMSLVGLGVSLVVLVGFVVPRIMAGDSPVVISAVGSLVIALTSLFLAHGFTKRTVIAFSATMFVLIVAFVISDFSVIYAMLSGANSEEAVYLQMGYLQSIDLRGLLLGGLVIGTLGVLDDVTTAQVAAVQEIFNADRTLSGKELYKRGISVGREHIASLVNTLALAYVGASFPLFLLFSLPGNPPLWVILNSESIAVEMLRAFIGGTALILAVPVATALAAWACETGFMKIAENKRAAHHH